MNIYEKLAEARKIVRESKIKKDGNNSFSGYDYFTPEQVETLVAEACEKTKTICLTNLKQDALGYYQTLDFIDLEHTLGYKSLGDEVGINQEANPIHFELRTDRPEIKATNATQQMGGMDTYSERYIKMKVFQIKDNNLDFDSQDNRQQAPLGKPKAFQPKKKPYQGVEHDERLDDAQTDLHVEEI